jgi:hypothetical protein
VTPYAHHTDVPVERSRQELDVLLGKHGADARAILHDAGVAVVGFRLDGMTFKIVVPMPTVENPGDVPKYWEFMGPKDRREFLAQGARARWRSLLLLVKAKLEAVRLGVSTVEREFRSDRLPAGPQPFLLAASS